MKNKLKNLNVIKFDICTNLKKCINYKYMKLDKRKYIRLYYKIKNT